MTNDYPIATWARARRTAGVLLAAGAVIAAAGCGTRLAHSDIANAGPAITGTAAQGAASGASGAGVTSGTTDTTGGAVTSGTTDAGTSTGTTGTSTGTTSTGSTGTSTGTTSTGTTGTSTGTTSTGTTSTGTTSKGSSSGGKTPTSGASTSAKPGAATASTAAPSGPTGTPQILGGNVACAPATKSPVTLGNVSTLSGVLGNLFHPVVPALQTFVKAQNACGGLNGHPINLIIKDDQGDPSTAASEAQDLIQNSHVLAFVGNIQVLTIDAMTDTINKSKVPIIGGDLTNDTWFSSPYIFPQGSPPEAISFGYLQQMTQVDHAKKVGDAYCIEVPQACRQIDAGFRALAPQFGATVANDVQISITSPSYTSQCLAAQDAGVEVMALTVDAPTQSRFANSCAQVGFHPKYIAYPLGVGNESEFFGNPNLANTYVPLNTFPRMSNNTPAEKFYQASVAKYNPGFTTGDAASLGWTAGALLVAATLQLSDNPTTAEIVTSLDTNFKGQASSTLGGLTAPLTFTAGKTPTAPYCLFGVTSNGDNTGWVNPIDKATCTTVTAPGAPK